MNRGFESNFGEALEQMIDIKTALGFSESTYLFRARQFDRFCKESYPQATELTEPLVLSWIRPSGTENAARAIHARAAFARTFADYLQKIGKEAYVLPEKYTAGQRSFVPYLFTDEEMTSLFSVIDSYHSRKGSDMLPLFMSTYFRLVYTCGLRPGEGTRIKRSDIDLSLGEIRIINSKWHKSRTVVMSDEMLQLAQKYAVIRDAKFPQSEYFFPKKGGRCWSAAELQKKFKECFALSKPDIPKDLLPAVRVYDLRHRFATTVLNQWLDEKKDLSSRLPYLRTYMGHREIDATAYYIHLLPENLVRSAGIDWDSMRNMIPRVELWQE